MYVSGDYQFGAALVRRRPIRPVSAPADRRVAHRHRRVVHPHVLAERVQPGARAVSAHQLRAAVVVGATSCCSSSSSPSARTARIRSREVHHEDHTTRSRRSPRCCCSPRTPAARARQAERHDDDRGSRVDRARDRRRSHHRRLDGQGLSGSALRRGEAELHPEAAEGRRADLRRPRARDRLAAAADSAEPQREDSGRRAGLSGRVARPRRFSRSRTATSRAPWATCIRSATRTTGWIRKTASGSPRKSPTSCRSCAPATAPFFQQQLAELHDPPGRRRKALARADGAVQGHEDGHLSPLVSRISPSASGSTSSATSSRGRAFRRRRSTRSISSTR